MGVENLTKDSSPCEICKELGLVDSKKAESPRETDQFRVCFGNSMYRHGYNSCLQKDRALIKLMYLNLTNSE